MWQLITDAAAWDALLCKLPSPHVLQSWAWGDLKSRWGWTAQRWAFYDDGRQPLAAVQLLRRNAGRLPLCVLYAPKGPVAVDHAAYAEALSWLERQARAQGAVWVKVDGDLLPPSAPPCQGGEPAPSLALPYQEGGRGVLQSRGWRYSPDQIQFRNTLHTDLHCSENELLAQMKQKWRYNIRLAEKRGVTVRRATSDDWPALYAMYAETGRRDGFIIREQAYYFDAWRVMNASAFIAEHPDFERPLAGLVLFRFAERAWYFYGMSRAEGREHMPNYLLQWAAMRWARDQGCATYDWWGAPDQLSETDAMWGVYRFKEGFGAQFVEGLGAWDFAPSPLLYRLYTHWMPALWQLARGSRPKQHTATS